MIPIDPAMAEQLKQQRLQQLQSYYFQLTMNKTAFEANGMADKAADTVKQMTETENSYNAISSM